MELLKYLWKFFGQNIYCSSPMPPKHETNDPSRFRIKLDPFLESKIPADLEPEIRLKKTHRTEEALVHELLHFDMLASGYPVYYFNEQIGFANSVMNICDHQVMIVKFESLGYDKNLFEGIGPKLKESQKVIVSEIKALEIRNNPADYTKKTSKYLRDKSIPFESYDILSMQMKLA